MQELIDRQTALEKMCGDCKSGYDGHCPHPFGMCHEYESILQVPTIKAKTVRHGRWIMLEPYGAHHTRRRKCSECGEIKAQELTNFCPNCGSDMRVRC